jgi:hypothetical protein
MTGTKRGTSARAMRFFTTNETARGRITNVCLVLALVSIAVAIVGMVASVCLSFSTQADAAPNEINWPDALALGAYAAAMILSFVAYALDPHPNR